jgi:hypothetical protein
LAVAAPPSSLAGRVSGVVNMMQTFLVVLPFVVAFAGIGASAYGLIMTGHPWIGFLCVVVLAALVAGLRTYAGTGANVSRD